MSIASDLLTAFAGPLIRLAADIIEGKVTDPKSATKALLNVGAEAIPVEDLRDWLDEVARERQDALFEAAKREKFGDSG